MLKESVTPIWMPDSSRTDTTIRFSPTGMDFIDITPPEIDTLSPIQMPLHYLSLRAAATPLLAHDDSRCDNTCHYLLMPLSRDICHLQMPLWDITLPPSAYTPTYSAAYCRFCHWISCRDILLSRHRRCLPLLLSSRQSCRSFHWCQYIYCHHWYFHAIMMSLRWHNAFTLRRYIFIVIEYHYCIADGEKFIICRLSLTLWYCNELGCRRLMPLIGYTHTPTERRWDGFAIH